jgi:hypothetical protein
VIRFRPRWPAAAEPGGVPRGSSILHRDPEEIRMRVIAILAATAALTLSAAGAAEAKGCIKGALVGGAAGHVVGHGVAGAAAGCVVGRHQTNKRDRAKAAQPAPR